MAPRRKETGVVLIITIVAVTFVAMLSLALLMQSLSSSRAETNSVKGEKALQIAETGIDVSMLDYSKGGSGSVGASFGGGTYSVTLVSYPNLTMDITSVGTYQGISRTVTVSAATFPLIDIPGAITLVNPPGVNGAQVTFDGNALTVDGNDTMPGSKKGGDGSGADMPGIAVFDDKSIADITAALKFPDNVTGTGGTPSITNVTGTVSLTLESLLRFADRSQTIADIYYPDGADRINNAQFGTTTDPKITVIGDHTVVGDEDLSLAGSSSGCGIMVVDGDLEIRGNFDYRGLIIVTGRGSMRFGNLSMHGNTKVYGAILVGVPTGSSITGAADIRGNVDVFYSTSTLATVQAMLAKYLQKPAILAWRRN